MFEVAAAVKKNIIATFCLMTDPRSVKYFGMVRAGAARCVQRSSKFNYYYFDNDQRSAYSAKRMTFPAILRSALHS